jgi:hypothetical protein
MKMNKYIAILLLAISQIPGTSLSAEFEGETGYYCKFQNPTSCKKGDVIFLRLYDALEWCDLSKPITPVTFDGKKSRLICVHRGEKRIERE